jgi:lysozyme
MQPSIKCVNLIKEFEGFRAEAYKCPAGVWTIGYGHTHCVKEGDQMTEVYADVLLGRELYRLARRVDAIITVAPRQGEFDALVSFAYNLGVGALAGSTLLTYYNEGLVKHAAEQFLRWNKAGGKVLAGLTRRREAERRIFCHDK